MSKLEAVYDGNPHAATATTSPAGLPVTVYYNGSTTPPSAVGRYQVIAVVSNPYEGVTEGTLEIYSNQTATTTWIVNQDSTVSHLSLTGAVMNTAGVPHGTSTLGGIAIDNAGNAWAIANVNSLVVVSSRGMLSGTYTGGGLSAPAAVAVDGMGMVWVADGGDDLAEFSNTGVVVSPVTGYLAATSQAASALSVPAVLPLMRRDLCGSRIPATQPLHVSSVWQRLWSHRPCSVLQARLWGQRHEPFSDKRKPHSLRHVHFVPGFGEYAQYEALERASTASAYDRTYNASHDRLRDFRVSANIGHRRHRPRRKSFYRTTSLEASSQ